MWHGCSDVGLSFRLTGFVVFPIVQIYIFAIVLKFGPMRCCSPLVMKGVKNGYVKIHHMFALWPLSIGISTYASTFHFANHFLMSWMRLELMNLLFFVFCDPCVASHAIQGIRVVGIDLTLMMYVNILFRSFISSALF